MTIKLYWPVEDLTRPFNQAYGANKPYYSQWGLDGHEGIDFYAPHGSNIFACAGGTVSMVNDPSKSGYSATHNYGIHVRVKHADGYETIYAHFHKLSVSPGETIAAGQVLGLADSTGNSTGSHLHLTLKLNGKIIDPTSYLVREHAVSGGVVCRIRATDGLNVRQAPSISAIRLGLIAAGTRLEATHYTLTSDSKTWYRVIYQSHADAWVHGDYVILENCADMPRWEATPAALPEPEPEVGPVEGNKDYNELYEMLVETQKMLTAAIAWFR